MLYALIALALAAPPLPTWTAAGVPPVPEELDPPEPQEQAQSATNGLPAVVGVATFEAPGWTGGGWADEQRLTIDVSADLGRRYYLMATARGGGMVAHWQQGPLVGGDQSHAVALELPAELPNLLQQVGVAHLALTLVVTDPQDREIGRSRVGKTWIELQGGVVVGGASEPPVELDEGGER